jgi:processive 1,2-diacylglycerol beta-glucosyltransferase
VSGPAVSGPAVSGSGPVSGPAQRPGRIVVISASVGAGHDGAAREWAQRLQQHGFETELYDLLDVLPRWSATMLREGYRTALHQAAWIWSVIFHLSQTRFGAWLVDQALKPYVSRVRALIGDDVRAVVSTYPLAGRMLARLRRRGALSVPVCTFVTDFSVHRLWVAKGVDATYVVHPGAADQARRWGARDVETIGPLVPERFRPTGAAGQQAARRRFGLPADGALALVVAGSWGVGDVELAAAEIERTGLARAVVACGHNDALRERLVKAGLGLPLGWVGEMDELLGAVDVLIENAGGLTSLEAMASGIPVITYRPIPGHGRTNAAALEEAGVSVWVQDEVRLAAVLRGALSGGLGTTLREAGLTVFTSDPVKPLTERAVR